jgi:hypothetical protein
VKGSSELYDIIHSLSMSEKRYISLSIMHQGDKAYLKLFKAISKQKEFDEDELRVLLKGEKFMARLPKIKYFLYNFILKKLSGYYWNRENDTLLNELFIETDILFKKNLLGQATKRMQKLKELAEENDEYEMLLQCYRWERRFSINSSYRLKTIKDRDVLLDKELELIKNMEIISQFNALSDKLYIFIKPRGDIRKESDIRELRKFLDTPILKLKVETLPTPAKILYHHFYMQIYYYLHENKNATKHVEKYLALLKPKISVNEAILKRYINGLNNQALLLTYEKDYTGALTTLEKMRSVIEELPATKNFSDEITKSTNAAVLELEAEIYLMSGQYKKSVAMIPSIEQFMKLYAGKLEPEYVLIFNYIIAYSHFIVGNYKQTILTLNKILNYTKEDLVLREDMYCYSKILYLIAHYEAGTEGLPDYLIKSTYRFLSQRKRLYKIESAILNFIRNKLLKGFNPSRLTSSLEELKKTIIEIAKDPYERKILEYFDYISWLESKISRRPFYEVISEAHTKH